MPDPGDRCRSSAASSESTLWLFADVVRDAGDWQAIPEAEKLVAAAVAAVARHPEFDGEPAQELCVALSDDASVRKLNAAYRGKDKATNVLSFPAGERADTDGSSRARPLGDIVLALETVLAEAAEQEKPVADHFQHLVVHGTLHLLGFDHETEDDAAGMEGLEIEILASLGIGDPYAGTEVAA